MTNETGTLSPDKTAVLAWLEELPGKDPVDLMRDQVILLSSMQQNLAQIQRQEARLMLAVEQLLELHSEESEVCVTDVEMPFLSMVTLILKWALALVPAAVILAALGGLVVLGLTALGWLPPVR